jgi:uncharacterized membrane protein HdeD (DUF308 family)
MLWFAGCVVSITGGVGCFIVGVRQESAFAKCIGICGLCNGFAQLLMAEGDSNSPTRLVFLALAVISGLTGLMLSRKKKPSPTLLTTPSKNTSIPGPPI